MRIVTAGRIKEWCKSHSVIAAALSHWLGLMENLEDCRSFIDLRRLFNTVDQVEAASGRTVCVFNLSHGKNAYRLISAIHFNTQIVYVLRLMTHAEYDKNEWKKEL
jgi:mRNA interferase HigB